MNYKKILTKTIFIILINCLSRIPLCLDMLSISFYNYQRHIKLPFLWSVALIPKCVLLAQKPINVTKYSFVFLSYSRKILFLQKTRFAKRL